MTEVVLGPAQRRYLERTCGLPRNHHALRFGVPSWLADSVIRDALAQLVIDHEVFGARFSSASAVRAPAREPYVRQIDAAWPTGEAPPAATTAEMHSEIDPANGRLLEAGLVVDSCGARELILVMHHLVTDIVSWGVIAQSLSRHVAARAAGQAPTPLAPRHGFWTWTDRLARVVNSGQLDDLLPTWLAIVDDRGRNGLDAGVEADSRVAEATVPLPPARAHDLSYAVPALVVGALAHALGGETRFELEGHGRVVERLDCDAVGVVGWFTCRFPVRVRCATAGLDRCLAAAAEALDAAPAHQASFSALRYLSPRGAELRYRPDVSVNFRGRGGLKGRAGRPMIIGEGQACLGESMAPTLPRSAPWDVDVVVEHGSLRIVLSYNGAVIDEAHATHVLARAAAAIGSSIGPHKASVGLTDVV